MEDVQETWPQLVLRAVKTSALDLLFVGFSSDVVLHMSKHESASD